MRRRERTQRKVDDYDAEAEGEETREYGLVRLGVKRGSEDARQRSSAWGKLSTISYRDGGLERTCRSPGDGKPEDKDAILRSADRPFTPSRSGLGRKCARVPLPYAVAGEDASGHRSNGACTDGAAGAAGKPGLGTERVGLERRSRSVCSASKRRTIQFSKGMFSSDQEGAVGVAMVKRAEGPETA